jgi:hypothetical protein
MGNARDNYTGIVKYAELPSLLPPNDGLQRAAELEGEAAAHSIRGCRLPQLPLDAGTFKS